MSLMSPNRNQLFQDRAKAQATAPTIIAFVGLLFEARIARGPGVAVLCRGTGSAQEDLLENAIGAGCRSIVSFGVAGGLAPDLRPGDWIVASAIVCGGTTHRTDPTLTRKLLEATPGAEYGIIAGVDEPIVDPWWKQELHKRGVAAVDMESHLVAQIAAARGLAFGSIRVVVDPVHRRIPAVALAGLRLGRETDAAAVLWGVATNPRELPLVVRLGLDAWAARKALLRIRQSIGSGFGLD